MTISRLVVLLTALLLAAGRACASPGFDVRLAAQTFSAALAFAAPRTLEPATPADLALWGLHGITAMDSALLAQRVGAVISLMSADHLILSRPAPAPDNAEAWGRLAAEMNRAAYEESADMRQAGYQALVQSFFDEMFNHLDPYSRYVPPMPAEQARDKLSLDATAGVGLVRQKGGVAIADLVPGGPGIIAGARIGDRILAVGGRSLRNDSVARVQQSLTGVEGSELPLKVLGLDGKVRKLLVTLEFVPPETVFASRDGNLFVLRVTAFDGNTAERLSQALEAGMLAKPPPAAIVLDLRGNRGGLLRQAVTAVALLAEQGIIASTAGRDPQASHDWRIDGGGDLTHGTRLVILVDGRTASAAEIMAAALADLGRGVVVGSTTLGKGLVQTLARLPDGGELYITWSRVLAPKNWPIQSLGIMPQVCTSRGIDELHRELGDLSDGRWDMEQAVARTRAARPPLPIAVALELRTPCPAAEGSDADMEAAHYLADHPAAFQAALEKP